MEVVWMGGGEDEGEAGLRDEQAAGGWESVPFLGGKGLTSALILPVPSI